MAIKPQKTLAMAPQQPAESSPAVDASKAAEAKPRPLFFTLQAVEDTWLKKSTEQASSLPADQKVAVRRGQTYGVVETTEIPEHASERVELASGAGSWIVYSPHFRRLQAATRPAAGPIDWSDFSCLVTPNLTVGEVLQFDHRRRPPANSADIRRILATAAEYQKVRTAWRRPLGVTSFYRPEPINRQVGGVWGSYHVSGLAVDLYPIGASLDSFYNWISRRWTGGLGDGRRRGFIHLDRRQGGFVPGAGAWPAARWPY